MKKNNMLKKLIVTSLAIVLLAVPTLSFADVAPVRGSALDKLDMRMESASANLEAKTADALAKRDAYRTRMTQIISDFAPMVQSDFDVLWSEHDSLHTLLIAERTRIMNENQAETKAIFDSVKAAVTAGDMTREEAKETLNARRDALQVDRAATNEQIAALKATYDVPEGTIKTLNEALKIAVESGDETAVANALTDILNSLAQHLTFDEAKLDYFQSK